MADIGDQFLLIPERSRAGAFEASTMGHRVCVCYPTQHSMEANMRQVFF